MAHKTTACTNCGDPVKLTKRSKTGLHFCGKADCVKKKAQAYYRLRVQSEGNVEKTNILVLVHTLAWTPRVQCPACGLTNALPGYKHPTPAGLACAGTPSHGELRKMGTLGMELTLAIWPAESREYAEVSA